MCEGQPKTKAPETNDKTIRMKVRMSGLLSLKHLHSLYLWNRNNRRTQFTMRLREAGCSWQSTRKRIRNLEERRLTVLRLVISSDYPLNLASGLLRTSMSVFLKTSKSILAMIFQSLPRCLFFMTCYLVICRFVYHSLA